MASTKTECENNDNPLSHPYLLGNCTYPRGDWYHKKKKSLFGSGHGSGPSGLSLNLLPEKYLIKDEVYTFNNGGAQDERNNRW